jgi:hypothetical protein
VHAVADGWLVSELVGCAVTWRYSDKHKVSVIPKRAKSADAEKPKVE